MDRISLDAAPRTITGKKVRFMRRNGTIPVNVFGHNVQSQALEVQSTAIERALARAGTNALITLNITGGDARPVLIRGYQRRPTTGQLLHVDLYQVSMTEKLRTQVPLVFVGIAPGVAMGGLLLKNLDALDIECLPGDLISAVEVDLSELAQIDDTIVVSSLKVGPDITVLTHGETVVVKLSAPEKEEEAGVEAEAGIAEPAAAPANE
jgi:large subunit ribosomal protein L25